MNFGLSRAHPVRHQRAGAGRAGRRGERGVTMVEAAFITPVFLFLLFGIFEFGLAMNDYLGVGNTVRASARTASAAGNDASSDYDILQTIKKESSALNRNDIQLIVIFKAPGFGAEPDSTCKAGTAHTSSSGTTPCNVYTVSDFTRAQTQFNCGTSAPDRFWCPTTRKVTLAGTGSDYIGVWMKVNHRWITRMFGTSMTLTDSSVVRLEPRSK